MGARTVWGVERPPERGYDGQEKDSSSLLWPNEGSLLDSDRGGQYRDCPVGVAIMCLLVSSGLLGFGAEGFWGKGRECTRTVWG